MNVPPVWHGPVVAEIHAIREYLADQAHLFESGGGSLPRSRSDYGGGPRPDLGGRELRP